MSKFKIGQIFLDSWKALKTKDSFIQNLGFVFGGKTLGFVIGFLMTPVIARLYGPDAYGIYALYNSLVVNISLVATLKLPASFVVIEKEENFKRVFGASLGYSLSCVSLVAICSWVFSEQLVRFFGVVELAEAYYLIPLGVFLTVLIEYVNHWNVRDQSFRTTSKITVMEPLGTKISSMGIGYWLQLPTGLVLGEFVGKFMYLIGQQVFFIKERIRNVQPIFNVQVWKRVLNDQREFPLFILPSTIVATLSNSIVIFFLSSLYKTHEVGYYSMAISLAYLPVMLIAYGAHPVIARKISELRKEHRMIDQPVNRFLIAMTLLGLGSIAITSICGYPIIVFFLGSNWSNTAHIVVMLMPATCLQFLFLPLTGVLQGDKKNRSILCVYLIRFILILLSLFIISYFGLAFTPAITVIICVDFAATFLSIGFAYHQIRVSFSKGFFLMMIVYLLISVVSYSSLFFAQNSPFNA